MIEPKQIIRSNRKSIALIINSKGDLIVRAPRAASQAQIMNFVNKKQAWIKEKSDIYKTFDEKYSVITMSAGDKVLFLGKEYTLVVADISNIIMDGEIMYIPQNWNLELLLNWLKKQALLLLKERTEYYSQLMDVSPIAVKISEAKTRWGSCSYINSLNFSWRLIMCPISVIDYVVVHELSHITYKDHSKSFWERVRTFLPNYKEQKNWLKVNKKIMDII